MSCARVRRAIPGEVRRKATTKRQVASTRREPPRRFLIFGVAESLNTASLASVSVATRLVEPESTVQVPSF